MKNSRLTETNTLWRLFWVFVGLSLAMLAWITFYKLHIIDEIWEPAKVQAALEAQTPAQHRAHFRMTLFFDLLYPFIYGPLFAGLTLKYLKRGWLTIPAFLCIPADTIENIAQLFILSGTSEAMAVKAIATPVKLICFIIALVLALLALGVAAKSRWGKP